VASGLGNIVDADMARAAANLTAAQVKQKLSTETLNISMSQPKIIQQLFPK
jgi:flagellin